MIASPLRFASATLLLSLIFACAVLLPHVLQRLDRQYPFRGVEIMANDAEIHYAARFREILDGHPGLGNTFFSSPKNQPSIQPPLPEWTLAMLSKFLHFGSVFSFVLLTGFCVIFTFLSAVLMTMSVTGKRYESLVAVSVMLFAAAAFSAPWDIPSAIASHSLGIFGWLRFARPVNPLFTMPLFFLTVTALSQWIRTGKVWWIIVASLLTTVLLYSYFYSWTYLLATVGILFLWYVGKGDGKRLTHLAVFFGLFVILGSPYFAHLSSLTRHPWYLETAHRQGLVVSHVPVFGVWVFAFILVALLSLRSLKQQFMLVLSLALAGIIALNQHVLTGQHLFPEHYHWYFIQPLGTLFATLLVLSWLSMMLRQNVYHMVLAVIVCIAMLFGCLEQYGAYDTYRDDWGNAQALAPILAYADQHLPTDSVAYSEDWMVVDLLPIYTSMNVYTATNAGNYLAPTERLRDTFFFLLWLRGLTPSDAQKQFPSTLRGMLGSRLYSSYYRELKGDYGAMPDALVQRYVLEYAAYVALPLEKKLALYPLDIFITAPFDVPSAAYKSLIARGKEVFAANGYRVLELKQ